MYKVAFLYLVTSLHIHANSLESPIVIFDNSTFQIGRQTSYFLDKLNLEFTEIQELKFHSTYDDSWYDSNGVIWIKFEITNKSPYSEFLLTIDQWQFADLYISKDNEIVSLLKSGTGITIKNRPENFHRLLTFGVTQKPGTTQTYFFKVKNQLPIVKFYAGVYDFLSKIEWQERSKAQYKYMTNQVLIWFVLGICFALIIFYLVQFYRKPKLDMIYLLLYVIVTSLFISNIHGITTLYFFRSFTSFELPLGVFLVHLSSILVGLYIRSYLKTKGLELENVLLISLIAIMSISLIVYSIDSSAYLYSVRRWIEGGLVFTTLIIAMYKKRRNAGFLLAAFSFALIGRYWSEYLSTHDNFIFGDIPYLAGFIIQLSLFTVGSSLRMLGLEKDVQQAIFEKNKILEDLNKQLNKEVKKRTMELERMNISEKEKNKELKLTISELEKAQIRLIETEKMASLGNIAAGLAHELNNPLNVIGGMMMPIQKDLYEIKKKLDEENDEEIKNRIEDIFIMLNDVQGASAKASRVVKNLNSITPENKNSLSDTVYLQELINHLIISLKRRFPTVAFNIEMDEKEIFLDGQMEGYFQLLQNIISNGIDAMSELDTKTIQLKITRNQNHAEISIRDFGTGIDPKLIDKIFEPFFTTKAPGKGTGLGLFIAKSIIIRHKGSIKINGNASPGSLFTVTFPISQ